MRKIALLIVAATAGIAAMPASAQPWQGHRPGAQREVRAEIAQLQDQIQRARQRGTISQREATGLRRDAAALRSHLARFSRDGLSRWEKTTLENRLEQISGKLRMERRDRDGRRG